MPSMSLEICISLYISSDMDGNDASLLRYMNDMYISIYLEIYRDMHINDASLIRHMNESWH